MKNLDWRNVAKLLGIGLVFSLATISILRGGSPPSPPPGELTIIPAPVDVCGMPPSAEDWRVMRNDGSVDKERSLEFAYAISEWDNCMTGYASGLYDYIFVLEGIRDSTLEAAGVYYQQFVNPSFQPPPELFEPFDG